MRTSLSSLKGYIITDIRDGERLGSMEIWGKVQGALKSAKSVRLMIINDKNTMFDKDGNWFKDVD